MKIEKMKEVHTEARKVVIEFADGTRKETTTGLVFCAEATDDPDKADIAMIPVNADYTAMKAFVCAAVALGIDLGMFDEEEEQEDE